jgi:hypothetical protein
MGTLLRLMGEHAATVVILSLGAAAAFASGRAIAQTWRPFWHVPAYMLLLAAVTRFCHFALFEEPLLDLSGYLVDLIVLVFSGGMGFKILRRQQMITQYAWEYAAAGPVGWRRKRGS